MSSPMFRFVTNSTAYVPWLGVEDDDTPSVADGVTLYDLERASIRAGQPAAALLEAWELTFAQFTGELLSGPAADSDKLRLRDAYVDRALRGLTPEQADDVRAQAEALGYNFATGECWATVVEDESGNKRGVCVAKLEALQARVLRSGLFDGRKGPVEFQAFDGPWMSVWTGDGPPYACRMTLCRVGMANGQEYVGLWSEMARDNWYYDQRPTEAMEKCVEAKGLRKLFRDVVGIVYIPEELPGRCRGGSRGGSGARATRGLDGVLTSRQSTSDGEGTAAVGPKPVAYAPDAELGGTSADDETIHTEAACRAAMAALGVPEPMQSRLIANARQADPLGEDDRPDGFWGGIAADSRRLFGRRRGSR